MSTHPKSDIPRVVLAVALGLVLMSLLNIVFLSVVAEPSAAKLLQRSVRFLLTCGLAFFLLRGAGWARLVTIGLAGLSFFASVGGAVLLPDVVPVVFRVVVGVMAMFYGAVAATLLFSPRAVGYFRTVTPRG